MKPKNAVRFDRTLGRAFYRFHRWVYRASGGRVMTRSLEGPMLMLTTTGRRSGQRRDTTLLYHDDGGRIIVVGSNGGRPSEPAWLLNLRADPSCSVMVGRRRFDARARILEGDERAAIWPALTSFYPGWAHYETLTERTLHPVELVPT